MGTAPEQTVGCLAILLFLGLIFYRFVRWLMEAKRTAEPWGEEVEQALNRDDTVAVCPQCLSPQQHNGWFCPECGATVGPYCNYLPFVSVFSAGEVFRAGVTGRLRRSPLIVLGGVLLSLAAVPWAAPFYWFRLFKHLREENGAVVGSTEGDGRSGGI